MTGQIPPALESRPSPKPHLQYYLEGFLFLSQFRGQGMNGPENLSFSQIRDYCITIGLTTTDAIIFFAEIMAGLDSVYLKHMNKQAVIAKQRQAAQQKNKPKGGKRR